MPQPERTYEEPPESPGRFVRLLTYVLNHDDLCAAQSETFALDALGATVEIGRGSHEGPGVLRSGSSFRLADRWASSRHATLVRHGASATVLRDEGSRNGVYVNGRRVVEHALEDGDLFEIGHSVFVHRVVDARMAEAVVQPADALAGTLRLGPTRTLSPEVSMLLRELARVAPTRESVLVLGETGAGKEMVAQTVHRLSGRAGPCVTVDCGAVPESLFESTFFGHRRGAFTGAIEPRTGEIERADGGTLFLDEVANTSVVSQAKLLRAIEDGRVTPLGASRPLEVDVRWIAATNRSLLDSPGDFRPDLLRRLAGYVARVPPLRRRREDLGVLCAYVLREAGVTRAAMTVQAARALFNSDFPGNVRQLRAVLRASAVLAAGEPITLAQLGTEIAGSSPRTSERPSSEPFPRAPHTPASPRGPAPDAAELVRLLREHAGNVVHVARALGTHSRQVYRWIERDGLSLDDFRRR